MSSASFESDGTLDERIARSREIDAWCNEFERQVRDGVRPAIEVYLARLPSESRRAELLGELLGIELELRLVAGEDIDADAYRGRFPDYSHVVEGELRRIGGQSSLENRIGSPSTTLDYEPAQPAPDSTDKDAWPEPPPTHVGRYEIRQLLGEGGFGRVFLAHDGRLDRLVAVKIPHLRITDRGDQVAAFVEEARTAARLSHPGLVVVYDVHQDGGLPYIVQQYIDGPNLKQWMRSERPSPARSVELMIEIGEAVEFLHRQGLVHRDLKSSNILIDRRGRAYVADFGLAIHGNSRWEHFGVQAGTWWYMSPEQLRGESHLLDQRSDVWSLGVILYELLVGSRPYSATTPRELIDEIQSRAPRPPRQCVAGIPRELERICLKCLEPRRIDRFTTAAALVDDLRSWQAQLVASNRAALPDSSAIAEAKSMDSAARVVPKGLRSFDERDSDFFLELLPGPFDREGLPESIQFWKSRIEQADADSTFRVGLLYGPSGCGKSSLMRAGILPRLAESVVAVYVETNPWDTEQQLAKEIGKRIPDAPPGMALVELLKHLREKGVGGGRKLLIVLDQFEQWLHSSGSVEGQSLVEALRQCDGCNVQCILMLRDDFWMAATRLLRDLEVPLVDSMNAHAVDNFSLRHAADVLEKFGRALGTLPIDSNLQSEAQTAFIQKAVSSLAENGKVICVRLALFSDMMKNRPWTPASLSSVGGAAGVGFTFLEETFGGSSAQPRYRAHAKAARAILAALLLVPGVDVRGCRQSREALLEASGYRQRPRDFDDLVRLLDGELRLITPAAGDDSPGFFQLTHDFLIPPLRQWLTSKQQGTRSGRAELRLAELTELWKLKPDRRYLPSLWELLSILWLTPRFMRSELQRHMLSSATRYYGSRASVLVLGVMVLAVALLKVRSNSERIRLDQIAQTKASSLVESLHTAETPNVPEIVRQIQADARFAIPILKERWNSSQEDTPAKLHIALALLPSDRTIAKYLYDQLLESNADRIQIIIDALREYRDEFKDALWAQLDQSASIGGPRTLSAAAALAAYDSTSPSWSSVADRIAQQLVAVNRIYLGKWMDLLDPVRDSLNEPLAAIYRDKSRGEMERAMATQILSVFAADRPPLLVKLICDSSVNQFETIFPLVAKQGSEAIELLEQELERKTEPSWRDGPLPSAWKPVDATTVSTTESSGGLLAERFALVQALPSEQFQSVCEALRASGYRPTRCRPYPKIGSPSIAALGSDGRLDNDARPGAIETIALVRL